ncbi:MAG: PP2C family protein-serine/threonine phosphatase [Vulcanimicrobiaceae bacterium]
MLEIRRGRFRGANLREATASVLLLMVFIIVALAGWYRIFAQLDRSAAVQRSLETSRRELSDILRIQLNEEVGLQEYLATRQSFFLDAYLATADRFHPELSRFASDTAALKIAELPGLIQDIGRLHDSWERDVARPLRKAPSGRDAPSLQGYGKVLAEQIDADADHVRELLDGRLLSAQDDLKRSTNLTLGGALLLILALGVSGILFVGSRARMLERIDRERSIVETLQGAFRTGWDELPGSRIGAAYLSATRGAAVGGDLFDVRRLDDARGLLVLADVSGKGVEAAVNTAFVKYSIRTLARTCDDPAAILRAFNEVFLDTIKDPGLFVVVFVGILDLRRLTLNYASAGHGGAYLRRAESVEQIAVTGPIVGLDHSSEYESATIALAPSDLLVLATDGLTEARDASGAPLDDQGAMLLVRESPSDPQSCADRLVAAVRQRSGGTVDDDLALLVIRIDGLPARTDAASPKAGAVA